MIFRYMRSARGRLPSWIAFGVVLLRIAVDAGAQSPSSNLRKGGSEFGITGRRLVYQNGSSAGLAAIVAELTNSAAARVRPGDLPTNSNYFLRLAEAKYFVDDQQQFIRSAQLGGTPYVFLTVPEAGYRRTLFGLYSDLGYDAESVLRQRGVAMVVLVLRYPDSIKLSATGEEVSGADWPSYIYRPTWHTAFNLFARLAGETRGDTFVYFPQLTQQERNLARYFPHYRREVIATLPYSMLRFAGGPDWEYRSLLESCMSMNCHFSGVGVTENTLSPADGRKGLPEFVGPNFAVTSLAECAILDLGSMEFVEAHRSPN